MNHSRKLYRIKSCGTKTSFFFYFCMQSFLFVTNHHSFRSLFFGFSFEEQQHKMKKKNCHFFFLNSKKKHNYFFIWKNKNKKYEQMQAVDCVFSLNINKYLLIMISYLVIDWKWHQKYCGCFRIFEIFTKCFFNKKNWRKQWKNNKKYSSKCKYICVLYTEYQLHSKRTQEHIINNVIIESIWEKAMRE